MSVFGRIFGGGASGLVETPAASVAASPLVPGSPNGPALPTGSSPGVPAVEAGASPLDNFKDLHQAPKEGEQRGGIPTSVPKFNLDPAAIAKHADAIDFMAGIDPALIDKAAKGDVEAFKAVQQGIARNQFAQSIGTSGLMTERALNDTSSAFAAQTLPELQRRQAVSAQLAEKLAFVEHPAVKPMFDQMKTDLANKYPNAPADAVTEHALKMFDGMMSEYGKSTGKILVDAPVTIGGNGRDRLGNEDWSGNGYFGNA